MLKGAIFDMDGVLVNNIPVHNAAFRETARRYGVEFDPKALAEMSGMGNREIFQAIFPLSLVERDGWQALAREKEALYREIFAATLTPMPGLIDFLSSLQQAGVRIAVGTSAPGANMDFVFDGLGIRHFFDAIANGDMVRNAKPDPEIYTLAVSKLGLQPGECVVFEDAPMGIEAARRAGVRCVAVASSVPRAELEKTPGVIAVVENFVGLTEEKLKELV